MTPLRIMINLLHAQATLTGTGYYSLYLADALLRLPQQPEVIGVTSPINRRAFPLSEHANYREIVWGHPYQNVITRRIEEWLLLHRMVAREKPDVFFGPSNFLPLRHVCPMAVTIHDMTFFSHPEAIRTVRRIYWHAWTKRTVRLADAILTVSQAAKDDIARYGKVNPERIEVVPNGTGEMFYIGEDEAGRKDRWHRLRRRLPNLPRRYVSFIGTLTPHKNVPRLIDAVALCRREGCEDLELALAGKRGAGFDAVEEAIRRNDASEFVHELRYVEEELLPAFYENARLHVLPSFTEGFGLPIVEAMAAGTPVVTGNQGAMAEVGGDAALLVDTSSTRELADAIKLLWRDEEENARRRQLGLTRSRLFTWEEAAKKTYRVLEHCAGSRPAGE